MIRRPLYSTPPCTRSGSRCLTARYVSVQALMNGGKREPSDAASTPVEMFGRFRDRIEKAASDEYEKGNLRKIQMRDAIPFVSVRSF